MRRTGLGILALGLAVILTAAAVGAQVPVPLALESKVPRGTAPEVRTASGFPLLFVENRHRHEASVRYYVEHDEGAILFSDTNIVFSVHGRPDLVLDFPGNCLSRLEAEARTPTRIHYLVGKEKAWRTDIPTFQRLRYVDLWPGIDFVLNGERGQVKYEFQVAPGADPDRIRMRYRGTRLEVDAESGNLVVRDSNGVVLRTDPRPVAVQGMVSVPTSFAVDVLHSDTARFSVGDHDPAEPLRIDPAFLAYCGYLVPGMNNVYDVAVDTNGAAFVLGVHRSTLTSLVDACVVGIRPDGNGISFVTYVGSSQCNDLALGIAVDSTGIYLGGSTTADEQSFPVKVGPDLTFNNKGANYLDGFVCKLTLDGKSIIYCGYIGGSQNDACRGLAVDASGAVWFVGQTTSLDYPVLGGPQTVMPGAQPACVTKVAPDGRSLVFSGFIGGTNTGVHYIARVEIDKPGDGYVCGFTSSDERVYTFPVKGGPQLTYNGGGDTFLAKIDGNTGAFNYCGYIGGAGYDTPWDVAVDDQGAAYVTGQTTSDETTFPVVGGPLTKYTPSNRGDGFVCKVAPDGSKFVYSGFTGGAVGEGIDVDARGRCYLGGNITNLTPPFPVGGALSSLPGGDSLDGFLIRLASDGRSLDYSGYLAGHQMDSIAALSLGPNDTVYVAGITTSNGTFPVTIGPNLTYNGSTTPPLYYGSFVAKVAEATILPSGTGKLGTAVTFTQHANDDVGLAYQAGTSLTSGPTPLGSRTLGLGLDAVLAASVGNSLPLTFRNYAGFIGANGTATATFHIPNLPMLVGQFFYTAFITLDPKYPLGIKSISDTASFQVIP